jgi:hypothetical protein
MTMDTHRTTQWTPRLTEAFLAQAADASRGATFADGQTLAALSHGLLATHWLDSPMAADMTGDCHVAAAMRGQVLHTLEWLRWLDPSEREVVWARACGIPWKDIAEQHDVDRTTAWRRWSIAIATITARLNAEADAATLQHRSARQATDDRVDSER